MKISIEKCFCINLDERKDRWEQSVIEFKKLQEVQPQIELIRVDAIKDNNGKKGLGDTFKKIINLAKENDWEYVWCVEDDFWVLDAKKIFDALENVPNDWDFLSAGAYFLQGQKIVNDYWMSVNGFCSTHFIIIKKTIYDIILQYDGATTIPIDRYLSNQIKNGKKVYIMHPMPCRQYGGFSDIRKIKVDYNDRNLPFIYANLNPM